MHHVSRRKRVAWPPCLRVVALGVALVLAGGACGHAGAADAGAKTKTSSIPVKAPARPKQRPVKWDLAVDAAVRVNAATKSYTFDVARQHVESLSLDLTLLMAASIYIGIDQWGWGETGFHFYREGWFGKSTGYGGIDKLGHAWSAHVMSDYLTWRLRSLGLDTYQSSITAALISGVAFLGVEIGDGFSHYGASYEDFVASAVGIGFSFISNTVPGIKEKVDFRMQYLPTGRGDSLGLGDYSGKKFLLAWKFSGFEAFKDGPLKYLELHTGYYTRGYNDWERVAGIAKERSPYVGIGLNLSELLLSRPELRDAPLASVARTLLRYIQVPYTYVASDHFR